MKKFQLYSKFIIPYKKYFILSLVASCFVSLASALAPYASRFVIDEGLFRRDMKAFLINLSLVAGLLLTGEIFKALQQFLDVYIRARLGFDLNKKAFYHIQHLPLSWHKNNTTGANVYKFDYDVTTVTDFIAQALPSVISVALQAVIVIVILLRLNWEIAVAAFIAAVAAYILPLFFSRKMNLLCGALVKSSEDVFKYLEEQFSRNILTKVFAVEKKSELGLARNLIRKLRLSLEHARWEAGYIFTSEISNKIVVGVISFYGGYEVIQGHISAGVLAVIMMYLYQLLGFSVQAMSFIEQFNTGLISCARLSEIFKEPMEDEAGSGTIATQEPIVEAGRIVFNKVSFGYYQDTELLKNISFDITAGSHIALVGPSGCGKTTLLSLMVRLYEPLEGNILIDNIPVKNMPLHQLRSGIGIALQEPLLWNDTVANNICFGISSATDSEIKEAARLALVDEFIPNLKDGYATMLGENACKLSEGQKQKIAIARALIKKPKILILDEAMASMDSASEERILENIKNCLPLATVIIVSHRFSAVRNARLAYYLSNPGSLLINTPEYFLKNSRPFIDLFAGQADGGA